MTSPRDEIDDWLSSDVRPLQPPPGSLDRIRRRARQRKTRQVVFTAAGCAVVLAAAVTVPRLVVSGHPAGGHNPPVAAGSTPSSLQPSASHSTTSSTGPDASASAPIPHRSFSYLSTTTSGTTPPAHFRPTSVTFVGAQDGTGNVVGAVIGQAGPPCATPDCTSLAGTADYGTSWYGVSAPLAPGPASSAGVSQLRFANLRDGWAFGPALYETSKGGWPWFPEDTFGQRVLDVEAAAGGQALAIFGTCTGTGVAYAANCTKFALYTSVAGSRSWTPVTVPAGSLSAAQAASAGLVVTGSTGYVLTPAGDVLSGPVSGGTWRLAGPAPCTPGQAQVSALPSQAQLAASPSQLLMACESAGSAHPALYTSADGASWQPAGVIGATGTPASLASAAAGQAVLATSTGIYYSADGGKTWGAASFSGTVPPSGFSFVGMTNRTQGVAVPARAQLGEIFVTRDGGRTWTPSPIAG